MALSGHLLLHRTCPLSGGKANTTIAMRNVRLRPKADNSYPQRSNYELRVEIRRFVLILGRYTPKYLDRTIYVNRDFVDFVSKDGFVEPSGSGQPCGAMQTRHGQYDRL